MQSKKINHYFKSYLIIIICFFFIFIRTKIASTAFDVFIRGYIADSEYPWFGIEAEIYAENIEWGYISSSISRPDGSFVIPVIQGTHYIFAEAYGYLRSHRIVRTIRFTNIRLFLTPDPFYYFNTPQPQGNLILCNSGTDSIKNPLWAASQAVANRAYSTFLDQHYRHYFNYYLTPNCPDIDGDGILDPFTVDDWDPTVNDLAYSLTNWPYNRLNTGPLYLYLTGLGTEDAYQIMPGQIIKAQDPSDPNSALNHYLDTFQQRTKRDLICLLEFSSSGSFCNDLIDQNTIPYSRTIITCTDSGTSYLDETGQKSFTGQLLNILRDTNQETLFITDPNLSYNEQREIHFERVKLLQGLFSQARESFWSQGHPFSTQPPQMVTAQGPHTLCAIPLSADLQSSTIPDPNILTITGPEQSIFLNAKGRYLDGNLTLGPNQIHFQSSDPTILLVTPEGEAYPNPDTAFNGKATILATIIDPNFTQSPVLYSSFTQSPGSNPDLLCSDPNHPCLGGVTGRIAITVDIPTEEFPAWKEKDNLPLAIIVAGKKEKQDYLWEDTHTISHYAYRTLLSRGYSRSRIKYLTHLKEELLMDRDPENDYDTDLDGDKDPNNDIDGIPTLEGLKSAIQWAKGKGTDSLTLILVDHGIRMEEDGNQKGGFYLNPDEVLTAHDLDLWLNDLQNLDDPEKYNTILRITIIIEACHSGLFIGPLSSENRIIITSTREGDSYIYAKGLVSFSYYLLTHLQSGADLASAYDSALFSMLDIDRFLHENRQYLNESHQRHQIDKRDLARSISLGGSSFIVSQDQPVVATVDLLPDPNSLLIGETLTIRAGASDLDGIDPNGVWALINATYSPPVFSGDPERPIVDLPRIELKPQAGGIYEGSYDSFIYPGPYSILVFARDKKGNVSLPYSASLNVEGEVQDRALLVAGWDPDPYRFSKLLNHAQWVLGQKRLSHIEPPLIAPSLNTLEDTLYAISEDAHQIFVYLIGQTEKDPDDTTVFRLNATQVLHPDTLNDWLDNLSAPRQVVLIDAPGAEAFFREGPNRIYLWSSSSGQSAFLEQGGHCAFSHFFFTSLYSGCSVFQAYNSSCWAMQYYSGQTPGLEDGHWDQVAQATYLGSPFEIKIAGTMITVPQDRTVWGLETIWADTNVTDPNVWVLIKTPQNETIYRTLLPENDRYEIMFDFVSQGTYTVIAYVEDPNGLIDYDTTIYTQTGIDPYEEDDSPYQATPFLINNTRFPQLHNLHDPTDEDWVVFHAFHDRRHEVWVEKKGIWKNCSLKASVYSVDANQILPVLGNDNLPLVLDFQGNFGEKMDRIYPNTLPQTGFYLLKFHYGCPQIPDGADTLYEISEITDGLAGQTGIISGHVRDSKYHSGIAGAEIIAECQKGKCREDQQEEEKIFFSGNTGLFYLLDYMEGYYQITATAPGYQKSIATYVPVTKNTVTSFTIELTPIPLDPNAFDPNLYIDIMRLYQTLIRKSYDDWEKEYIVTLYPGMNLLSFPCQPKECDSNCFLLEMDKVLDIYSQERGILYDSNMSIHRYDSQDKHWQVSYMDINHSPQGDIFDLDPYEGYLVYIQFRDPNYNIKDINIPLTYTPMDGNGEGYDFYPPIHSTGFFEAPPGYTLQSLFEDPELRDSLEAVLYRDHKNGAFSAHYRFFGRPHGLSSQIVDDKGYLLSIKEEIHDWQP